MTDDNDAWRCATCRAMFPVPTLARACEHRHETEGDVPPAVTIDRHTRGA